METCGKKPLVKRGSEKEVGIPRKKLKMDETVRENQSDTVGGCGRRLKNSYRKYISKCYGRRKKNTVIVKKRNEEVVSGDVTDKTDDFVVQQLSYGSDAFNKSFIMFLNENYGEGDEVSNSVNNKGEKLVVCNENDEEFEILEVLDEYLDEEFDVEVDVYDYENDDDNEDNQVNIEISKKEEEMKRKNLELKRREEGVRKKLKNYNSKSFTQTRIDERNMAKNLNISPLLKSEVGSRKSVKKSKEVIADEKEVFRFLGLPVAYSREGEVLAFFSGITLDEAGYIDDVAKEEGDVVSKILDILSI